MEPITWLVVIGAVVIIGAVIVIIVGMQEESSEDDPLEVRLAEYAARGEQVTLEEIELSQSITDRVFIPAIKKIGEITARFTPQNVIDQTSRKLKLAGSPRGLDPTTFWTSRFIVSIAIVGFFLLLFSVGSMDWSLSQKFFLTTIFGLIGFFVPQLLLQSKINSRQREIRKAMPDALDLLTICVQAGLGFDAAMAKVAEKWNDELSDEFSIVLREIQLGVLRRVALRNMAERIGIPEITSFVAAIIQSEQLGVSMAKVLRIQSDQMRTKRRQLAEEAAQRAPVKMLFPMAFLIFPSLLVILLGPAFLLLKDSPLAEFFMG